MTRGCEDLQSGSLLMKVANMERRNTINSERANIPEICGDLSNFLMKLPAEVLRFSDFLGMPVYL